MIGRHYMASANSLKHRLREQSLNVEILMGHDIGLADCYYKPSEEEILCSK